MKTYSQWQITAEQAERAKENAVMLARLLDVIAHEWTTEQVNLRPSLGMAIIDAVKKVKG